MVVVQRYDAISNTEALLLDIPIEGGLHYFEASIGNNETTTRSTVLNLPGSLKENGDLIRTEIFQDMAEGTDRTLTLLFVDKVGCIYYSYDWHSDDPIPLKWTWYKIVSEQTVQNMIEQKLAPLRDLLDEISLRPGMPEFSIARERFEKAQEELLTVAAAENLPEGTRRARPAT
jgi:hypothetical protein